MSRSNFINLQLAVTRRCNMMCPHCGVASGPETTGPEMPADKFVVIINELNKDYNIGDIRITGGEPLLKSGLMDILSAAHETGARVVLESNATLVSEGFANQIADKVDLIGVSLDSLSSHGKYRRTKLGTEAVIRGIKMLVDAGCNTQIATIVASWNKYELAAITEFAHTIGVKRMRFLPNIVPTGRARSFNYNASYLHRMYKAVFKIVDSYGDRIDISSNIPIGLFPAHFLKNKRTLYPGVCHWDSMVGVLPDGSVALCGSVTSPELMAEKTRGEDIGDVYMKSNFFRGIREAKHNLWGVCSNCIYRNLCSGYCRVFAHAYYQSINAPFPPCQIMHEAGLFPTKNIVNDPFYGASSG